LKNWEVVRMSWSLAQPAQALLRLRNRHFLLLDVLVLCVTPAIALMLRVDGVEALGNHGPALLLYTGAALIITVAVFIAFGLYSRYWRYASIDEMLQIAAASLVATLLVVTIFFAVRIPALGICGAVEPARGLPRLVPFIDAMLLVLTVGATRVSVRTADLYLQQARAGQATRRVWKRTPARPSPTTSSARATCWQQRWPAAWSASC
jgi:FlaA1/EpsC-like NDP-sugar epimerase